MQIKLITLSGLDSAGKSTQIDKVINYLNLKKQKVRLVWSRGGYTPIFHRIKILLRKLNPNSIPNPGESKRREKTFNKKWIRYIWIQLALIDMIFLYSIYFRILNVLGYIIIADRYIWDTFVDFKMKFRKDSFESYFLWKTLLVLLPKPDISFLIVIPVEVSLERSNKKNEPFSENLETRKNRIKIYEKLIDKDKWNILVDGTRSIDEVWGEIKVKLK